MQHQFGPWILVSACERLPHGAKFMYTFLRVHESDSARGLDLLRGFGATETEAARDAASCLVNEAGLPA
jgi:hypothetical protein